MGAKDELPKIKRLILAGKDDEAETMAKAYVRSRPRLRVRDAVAVRHRALRREFLKFQRDNERTVRAIFQAMADKAEKSILAAAGDDGKIPLWKINPLIKRLKQLNTEAHTALRVALAAAVRDSIWYGITVTMKSAQAGLDVAA